MGKIVSATYITLDGDMTNMQDWHFEYFGEDAMETAGDQMSEAEALIMGRKTYDAFAEAWAPQSGAESGADMMNGLRKYVVSSTLKDPTWNNSSVISGDVVGQIHALKEETPGIILQYGFGPVTRLMLDNDLLDELRFWLHPVISGKAKPEELLYRDALQTKLKLTDTNIHSTGTIVLTYTPIKKV